jgi:hypothetical protein
MHNAVGFIPSTEKKKEEGRKEGKTTFLTMGLLEETGRRERRREK